MFIDLLSLAEWADDLFWSYIGFFLIMSAGLWLTIKSRCMQIISLPYLFKFAFSQEKSVDSKQKKRGVHPFKLFCASVGGTVGIGNITGVVIASALGGPGAVFWVWVAGILGTVVKYSEVYLGMKYRIQGADGLLSGGPMFFLEKAFKNRWIPLIVTLLLCIYSVEVFQFSIIVEAITLNFAINKLLVIFTLLALVLYLVIGGVERVANLCTVFIPIFTVAYMSMGGYILWKEAAALPKLLSLIFTTAFTGHAAVGGFIGSSLFVVVRQGLSRAAYSGDIGVGFDAVIQSASTATPQKQASLSIFSLLLDNLMCTISLFIVLLSGVWLTVNNGFNLFQTALSQYIPYTRIFLPFLLFVTGYTTITSYFAVGIKCASYISKKWGRWIYLCYGTVMLFVFSFVSQRVALLLMSVSGGGLLIINLSGIFILRKEIEFPKKK